MVDLWYVFKKDTIDNIVIEESWIDFAIVDTYREHKIVTPQLKMLKKASRGFSKALIIKHGYVCTPYIIFRVYNKSYFDKKTYECNKASAVKILYTQNDFNIEEMPEPPIQL